MLNVIMAISGVNHHDLFTMLLTSVVTAACLCFTSPGMMESTALMYILDGFQGQCTAKASQSFQFSHTNVHNIQIWPAFKDWLCDLIQLNANIPPFTEVDGSKQSLI